MPAARAKRVQRCVHLLEHLSALRKKIERERRGIHHSPLTLLRLSRLELVLRRQLGSLIAETPVVYSAHACSIAALRFNPLR